MHVQDPQLLLKPYSSGLRPSRETVDFSRVGIEDALEVELDLKVSILSQHSRRSSRARPYKLARFDRPSNLTVWSVGTANSGWTSLALSSLISGTLGRMQKRFGLLLRTVRAWPQMN
jgi:hypothetical protein